MKKIIIFGAGTNGKLLKRILESPYIKKEEEYEVCFWCDNREREAKFIDGVEVLRPSTIKKRNINYDIVISSMHIADSVMTQLKELDISNVVYLVADYVYKFKWDNLTMPFLISVDINKPRMPYLEYKLVEHCNLKCNGCSACANINEAKFMKIEEFERDLICLKRLYSGIKYLKLFGGEPLLHPDLNLFIEVARGYFPDAELVVHSNGVLVPHMAERILKNMKKLDVMFVFTLYPETGKKRRLIEDMLNRNGVEYRFTEPVYEFRRCINGSGDYDAQEVYQTCCKCINLIDGTVSCGMGFLIDKLEKQYGVRICEDKFQHCINIHTTEMDGWQINKLLDSPYNLCRYCAFMRYNENNKEDYFYEWKSEKPELEDWVFYND